jgi:protein-S-isoprenylcysteine O-methyltransferase Ste14
MNAWLDELTAVHPARYFLSVNNAFYLICLLDWSASMKRTVINFIGVILTWIAWLWLIDQELSLGNAIMIAVAGVLAVIPVAVVGRRSLDRRPKIEWTDVVTTIVHYLVAILFGSAVIAATKYGLSVPGWSISISSWCGLGIMIFGGICLLIVVINLAIKGLGAPFAIAQTRLVAAEWMYAWTRNPMVLSGLVFLFGLGLWLQSILFLLWLIILVSPIFTLFLKVYEERELEIRFGEPYLEYKARTPMLFPRKPEHNPDGGV